MKINLSIPRKSDIQLLALACLIVIVSMFTTFAGYSPTSALSGSDWRAGNIIEDYLFYDNNSMSLQDIQNFMNSKVTTCDTNGTEQSIYDPSKTNAQYAAAHGLAGPPYVCLKDYMQVPRSDTIVDNFSGSIPAGAISSAQIIKNAADTYGVNPKALLVLLQKESPGPLLIDNWPVQHQYKNAMGFGCPDTAPCNPSYAGFYNQMTNAAKQIRYYKNNPQSFRHQPQKTANVYYNPNAACSTSAVYIQNYATAGLYNYTPYQPNQAALNNLYGTGDGCSAYGNRNFWRIYNDWFGAASTDWQVYDQAVYIDAARTKRIDYYPSIQPNTTVYAQIKAKNIGTTTWDQMTRLATNNPAGRNSIFYDSSDWLSPNRPATPQEGTVAPGQVGTFNFTLKSPSQLGAYPEAFILVQDGVRIFPDRGQVFSINVTNEISANRSTANTLKIGSIMKAGSYLLSPEANTALYLKTDGNLVLLRDFQPIWQTGTPGYPDAKLAFQGDGNLVLYSKDMKPLWSTSTNGTVVDTLILQYDSNLVMYGPTGAVWSSQTNTPQLRTQVVNNKITGSRLLLPGQQIETPDRTRMLYLQGDGNLVLYSKDMKPLWNSGTYNNTPKFLAMQSDGNLVLYDINDRPLWNSGTAGKGSSRLILQDDTNLVIYSDSGQATWASYTNR